jgi:hypothetical protein
MPVVGLPGAVKKLAGVQRTASSEVTLGWTCEKETTGFRDETAMVQQLKRGKGEGDQTVI